MFAPNETTQTTGVLEQLPRVLERQSTLTAKRQRIIAEKNTDTLPPLTPEAPSAKVAWRQVVQLRKENTHLRVALENQRTEMQKVLSASTQLQSEFDHETALVHQGHQQDLAYYQKQLQALMDERNQLSEKQQALEERYQALQQSFQDTVQAEAHKLMQEAAEAAILSPEHASPLVQDVVKTVELHVRQEEDKHLAEALYLKREVQRMADFLQQERQKLRQEQQQFLSFQLSVREQTDLRQKLHEKRLSTHQQAISLATSFSLLVVFIILEFICLALFHVPAIGSVTLSILIPVIVCILLRTVLAHPLSFLKTMHLGAPHKRRAKAQA